jgi:tetratricopeptide (TPR) repeat protein
MRRIRIASYLFIGVVVLLCTGCNREARVKIHRAQEYMEKHEYGRAAETLETINPSRRTANVNLLLGKIYGIRFEFEKADHALQTTYDRFPAYRDSVLSTYRSIAERFVARKRTDLAILAYTSLLDLESEYNIGDGFYILGHHYVETNDLAKAMLFLEKAVAHVNDRRMLTKSKIELIDIYEVVGRYPEAIELALEEESTELVFRRGKLSYLYAQSLFSKREYDSALAYCESIIVIQSPRSLIDDTYFLMGEIFSANNNYLQAVKCYKEVVKMDKFGNSELAEMARKKIEVMSRFKRGAP